MQTLVSYPLAFFVVSLALMSAAAWIGSTWLRRNKRFDGNTIEDFEVLRSASLTLLALIIGFSLSMAVNRYDQRKNYEEEEANAIGTEFIRADFLPHDSAENVRALLKDYLAQRIQHFETSDAKQREIIERSTAELQSKLWGVVRANADARRDPMTALTVSGMNDVINTQGYSQAAGWNRIPIAAWVLMIFIGFYCNLLVGYGSRSEASRGRFLLIMPMVISLSFMLIADIDSPRKGIIRVLPQNLIAVANSLQSQNTSP